MTFRTYTAEMKSCDPDFQDEEIFKSWQDASEWLLFNQKYFRCQPMMWINGEKVKIHRGAVYNAEAF